MLEDIEDIFNSLGVAGKIANLQTYGCYWLIGATGCMEWRLISCSEATCDVAVHGTPWARDGPPFLVCLIWSQK